MKKKSISSLTKTTLLTSAIALGSTVILSDVTPDSWNAYAGDKTKGEKSESKCGEGNCGEDKKKMKAKKGSDKSCGEGNCGEKKKGAKKGSNGSCGENTCGA